METVPQTHAEKIQYFQAHIAKWLENADAIGLSAAEVAEIEAKTLAARQALNQRNEARAAARSATLGLKMALAELSEAGSQAIMKIRTRAATYGNSVYAMANLPAPAQPSPLGAPGTPYDFKAALDSMGALTLRWKCKNPRNAVGTMYQVWRRRGYEGRPEFLGASGRRRFIDCTVPEGSATLVYEIVAIRSTARGNAAQFTVHLGVPAGMQKMLASFRPLETNDPRAAA